MPKLIRIVAIAALLSLLGYQQYVSFVDGSRVSSNPVVERPQIAAVGSGYGLTANDTRYDLRSRRILQQVILLIKENYVDPNRVKPYDMLMAALDYVEKTVPEILVDETGAPKKVRISVGTAEHEFDLSITYLWEIGYKLRDIFEFIQNNVGPEQDLKEIEYAAINGMLSTLDPHSVLLKPENFDEVKLATKGEFGGLGIQIVIRDGWLTIVSPMDGTPAAKAGLKPLDRIVQIGEESTINMGVDEAVQHLRGKPNTKVAIAIMRNGLSEPKHYVLTRALIKIESVSSELLSNNVGYLKIKSFQANTYDDVYLALERMKTKANSKLKGLILDLRNNPGGLLDQAISISDLFIAQGQIVITVGEGNKKREEKLATAAGTDSETPLVVLINSGSASASEIVAGALKNNNRALVIGQQSFGKGSVQVLYDFKDQSALKLTVAQYLTPGNISIQSVGIAPDVLLQPGLVEKDNVQLFAHMNAMREKDLEKHLDRQNETQGLTDLPPTVTLTYLVDRSKVLPNLQNSEGEDDSGSDVINEKPNEDFEVKFAKEILSKTTSADRRHMLETAKPLFVQKTNELEDKTAKALTSIGIDWTKNSLPKSSSNPALELNVSIRDKTTGEALARTKAGDEVLLSATLHNSGNEPIFRLYAISNSDDPLFDKREFPFGKVMPGQSRVWEIPIKIPKDMFTRVDEIKVKLENTTAEVSGRTLLSLDQLPRPHFAYNWQLHDNKGDSDGMLDPGAEVEMDVGVKNTGHGTGQEVYVGLKNLAGDAIYVDQGRSKIGTLAPNEEKHVKLHFSLRSQVKKPVELKLSVTDLALGEQIADKLTFQVNGEHHHGGIKVDAKHQFVRVLHDKTGLLSGANPQTPSLAILHAGNILKSNATVHVNDENYYRVTWDKNRIGYLATTSAELTPESKTKESKHVDETYPLSSPNINVIQAMRGTRTTSTNAPLKGMITSQHPIRDVYVFMNEQKIYYRALPNHTLEKDGLFHQPFEAVLKLKPGTNTVTIVAREDQETASRETFILFRENTNAAVAAAH